MYSVLHFIFCVLKSSCSFTKDDVHMSVVGRWHLVLEMVVSWKPHRVYRQHRDHQHCQRHRRHQLCRFMLVKVPLTLLCQLSAVSTLPTHSSSVVCVSGNYSSVRQPQHIVTDCFLCALEILLLTYLPMLLWLDVTTVTVVDMQLTGYCYTLSFTSHVLCTFLTSAAQWHLSTRGPGSIPQITVIWSSCLLYTSPSPRD